MDIFFKKCCSCKETRTLDMFHNSKNGKYGKHHCCKICRKNENSRKEYCKKWASENKELKSKIDREYRIKIKLEIIEKQKKLN